jgi:hypothetical protein
MKTYYELFVNAWQKPEGHLCMYAPTGEMMKCLLKPGTEEELFHALDAAAKAAKGNDAVQKRIAFEKKRFNRYWHNKFVDFLTLSRWSDAQAAERIGTIKIDGVLDETDWVRTPTTAGSFLSGTNGMSAVNTYVNILYDSDAVYFGITAFKPLAATDQVFADQGESSLWNILRQWVNKSRAVLRKPSEDFVEIFIDAECRGSNYYHFAVNPEGTIYEAWCVVGGDTNRKFKTGGEAACRDLMDRWVAEVKIPADKLGKERLVNSGIWRVDIGRRRRVGGKLEKSTWTDGAYYEPGSFRIVAFGEPPIIPNGGMESTTGVSTNQKAAGWQSYNFDKPTTPMMCTVAHEDVHWGQNALKIERGGVRVRGVRGDSTTVSLGDNLHIELWAKGQGKCGLYTTFSLSSDIIRFDLKPEWTHYSFDYCIKKEKEFIPIFYVPDGTMWLDDVSIVRTSPEAKR